MLYIILLNLQIMLFLYFIINSFMKIFIHYLIISYTIIYNIIIFLNILNKAIYYMKF